MSLGSDGVSRIMAGARQPLAHLDGNGVKKIQLLRIVTAGIREILAKSLRTLQFFPQRLNASLLHRPQNPAGDLD